MSSGASPRLAATAPAIAPSSNGVAPPESAASGGVAVAVSPGGATGSLIAVPASPDPLHATEAGRIAAYIHTAHPPRRQNFISASSLQDVSRGTLVPSWFGLRKAAYQRSLEALSPAPGAKSGWHTSPRAPGIW